MKSVILRYLSGAILLAASFAAFAVEGPDGAPGSHGGLQISLSTGGYRFVVEDGSDETVRARGKKGVSGFERRTAFPASVLLANRSNTDLKFAFPNEAAAERHFRFRLFDRQGKELWISDETAATVQTEATLERRSTWRRTVLVPLKINGAALAPGTYTLEALLDADQQLGATAIFEIVAPRNPDPDTQTGIKGRVVQAVTATAGENIPGLTEVPLKGVPVAITEILDPNVPHDRSPFFWQGLTNDDGQFEQNTPPGRFRVTATLPLAHLPITRDGSLQVPVRIFTQSVEVTVEPGIFRETVLRFPAKPPSPPSDTGIRGLVLIGPINPAQQPGEANEAPLAGAQVRVEEIRLRNARYSRPAFAWSGVTNIEGRFQVRTPAGKFRVTARQALIVFEPRRSMYQRVSNVFTPGNQAFHDVIVEEGSFSSITLRVDSGVR